MGRTADLEEGRLPKAKPPQLEINSLCGWSAALTPGTGRGAAGIFTPAAVSCHGAVLPRGDGAWGRDGASAQSCCIPVRLLWRMEALCCTSRSFLPLVSLLSTPTPPVQLTVAFAGWLLSCVTPSPAPKLFLFSHWVTGPHQDGDVAAPLCPEGLSPQWGRDTTGWGLLTMVPCSTMSFQAAPGHTLQPQVLSLTLCP